ncbi:RsfA family transcriptional regulator [Pseudogracilibacillus sp. SE30717A]|uniref:RsfA family transcriptional regulator n=1 Tax=Pseudogracilibacillus sp. SE30717A TaxID=3098293 RepID=UPI00300E5911
MAKVRQDAWSHEDDLLLAETVLRHIREGSTQLNAFEEVGDELNRTSAACGFRWNAEVRNKYIDAIELAKRQRKERKRAQAVQMKKNPSPRTFSKPAETRSSLVMEPPETTELTIDHVVHFLQNLQQDYYASNQSIKRAEKIQSENNELREQIIALERELSITKKKLTTVEEDYKTFIQIMERARKMTVLEDQGSINSPTFKMDKNGNLEQFAHGSSN